MLNWSVGLSSPVPPHASPRLLENARRYPSIVRPGLLLGFERNPMPGNSFIIGRITTTPVDHRTSGKLPKLLTTTIRCSTNVAKTAVGSDHFLSACICRKRESARHCCAENDTFKDVHFEISLLKSPFYVGQNLPMAQLVRIQAASSSGAKILARDALPLSTHPGQLNLIE